MKILALSGSLRPGSTNAILIQAIATLAAPAHAVTIYEGMGDLPHFSPDRDGDTPDAAPEPVRRLRGLLADADAVVICTPEYAHGMPGSLKNLLDWIVSSGEFDEKPTAALSASPSASGGDHALGWLVQTLRILGAPSRRRDVSHPLHPLTLRRGGEPEQCGSYRKPSCCRRCPGGM